MITDDPNLSPVFHDRGEDGRRWVAQQIMERGAMFRDDVVHVRGGGYRIRLRPALDDGLGSHHATRSSR